MRAFNRRLKYFFMNCLFAVDIPEYSVYNRIQAVRLKKGNAGVLKLKKLYLVCNAHIDPVWQWERDEGVGLALSTFKTAADLCEGSESFVFCHNEALLYEWAADYAPELFSRIKKLIKNSKWRIIGGWYLQPDCNMPSGEAVIRQIMSGYRFFTENFGAFPKTAVNFDSFGHSRGLVQILKKAGYETYLFMRPDKGSGMLESLPRYFTWEGFGGESIPAFRLETPYSTPAGGAAAAVEEFIRSRPEQNTALKTWGIGDHGGGPSRCDLADIEDLILKYKDETEIVHASPDDFFAAADKNGLPVWDRDLNPMFIGCYTSMHDVKKLYRELENRLFMTEKAAAAAFCQGLAPYPGDELAEAGKILCFSAFHDTLSGTISKKPEQDAVRALHFGLEILSRVFTKAFYAFLRCQEPAAPGVIPVFVCNPHPYPAGDVFECEYTLADYNWSDDFHRPVMFQNGIPVPCQTERESGNVPVEFRKGLVFEAEIPPMCLERFDLLLETVPRPAALPAVTCEEDLVIGGSASEVVIGARTGRIRSYSVNRMNMVREDFCELSVYVDSVDPWGMGIKAISEKCGRFEPMSPEKAAAFAGIRGASLPPVRITEDGDVRTVVEALFEYHDSAARILYKISKNRAFIDVELTVYWNEKSRLLRLCLPAAFGDTHYSGQTMFGVNEFTADSGEAVHQKWTAAADFSRGLAVTVINDSVYGLECGDNGIRLSLLRSPAYAAMPLGDREILPQNRFSHRIDQGEKSFLFRIEGGPAADRLKKIDLEAQLFGERPHALGVFPVSGERIPLKTPLVIDGARLETFVPAREDGFFLIRLFNTADSVSRVGIASELFGLKTSVSFKPYEFKTFKIGRTAFYETDLFENKI